MGALADRLAVKSAKSSEKRRPARGAGWIVFPTVAAALLPGCIGSVPGEPTGTSSTAIFAGVLDNDAQANASVVAIEIGDGTTFTLCSGALVGPDVVLTARHCVSAQAAAPNCDDNGNSLDGANFGADLPVTTIHVFAGPSIYQGETATANAKALYHPSGTTLCNADLALIVLDQSVSTVAPMRVRLSSPVKQGESVRTVGFGQNDQGKPIGTRFRKDDVSVLAVGSVISASQTPLGANEFELGESSCLGDSGGPAIDEATGAIVGIVSRGPVGADGGDDCATTSGNVYTSLAGFTTIFQQAFAAAGGSWVDESAPVSAGDGGASSSGGSSGSSGSSGNSSGGHYDPGGANLQSGKGPSCSASGIAPSAPPWEMMALVLGSIGVVFVRRRVR